MRTVIYCLLLSQCVFGSQNAFSVNDDVFAYPQYEIEFSSSYVLEQDAAARIHTSRTQSQSDLTTADDDSAEIDVDYEQMTLHGHRYLCSIPHARPAANTTKEKPSKEDEKKELVRAADRGWQLLQDMEGKQCLYYSTGWWSYAFCYNSYVKQFHSLPPSPGGARPWPPQEDQTTPSYFLGKYDSKSSVINTASSGNKHEVAELQTRADGNYLVQKLEGGTPCDLTGKNRKIEIEFHCHPQTTDRIGWIKETTTCTYLMVVYTPRLCNDIAFQPLRDSQAHTITCQEILALSEAAQLSDSGEESTAVGQAENKPIVIGKVEVGGMKHVGKDGKRIERGRIVMTPEEKAEIIIMQKDGQIQGLSRTKLKELNIKPEEIDQFKKELQELAGNNDWKVERIVDEVGQIILQGIVSTDEEDNGESTGADTKRTEEKGSEEEVEQEL